MPDTPGRPFVSIITATFNAASELPATAASLAALHKQSFEWIIVDGGSTDDTMGVVGRNSDLIAYSRSEPDAGIYDAWNKALAVAKGEWISFLGAGDLYRPGALDRYADGIKVAAARGDAPLEYVSSRVQLMKDGRPIRVIGQPWEWRSFRNWMTVAHVGSLHHRSLFEGGARFDTSYKITGDYEFLLRKTSRLRTAFVDSITAEMLAGGNSDSLVRATREAERAKRSVGARNPIVLRAQRYVALVKAGVRRQVWY